ncbi:cache domain-containing protein [Patescibacteria group bacterium]|nr:cache domain-containing protein [Patescibacteria group bacterium]
MYLLKKSNLFIISPAILLILVIFISGCNNKHEDLDLTMYKYRDTKDLVNFVYDASLILKKEGMKSLAYFRNNRKLFNTPDYYLYIYDMKGTNIYHAGMENLEGKNLWNVTDKNGKKITQLVLDALDDRNNPHAWVHYSWWEPGKFYSVPKSSCHFKVETPEGKELFVGAGINYPHEEQEFIRIIVDDAAQLIEDKGREALADISNPVSKYNYREVSVFAFHPDGELLISPAINSTFSQTNLLDCTDEVRHKPFANAIKKLESADGVWEVFMAKNRYQRNLIKKCLYVHKSIMAEKEIYVAAITDLPEPPY